MEMFTGCYKAKALDMYLYILSYLKVAFNARLSEIKTL